MGDLQAKDFDSRFLDSLSAGNDDDLAFMARLFATFKSSAADLLADLRDAVRRGDCAGIARAAHPLKSSSAQLGLKELSALAKRMEASGRDGSVEGADELMQAIDVAYERSLAFFSSRIPGAGDVG